LWAADVVLAVAAVVEVVAMIELAGVCEERGGISYEVLAEVVRGVVWGMCLR